MSLTYTHSNEIGAASHSDRPAVLARPTTGRRLKQAGAAVARALGRFAQAIAESRMQRALIEAELYHGRFIHSSKNDDDLPVAVTRTQSETPAMLSRLPSPERASDAKQRMLTKLQEIYPVAIGFAIFAVLLAAIIALRIIIWMPSH